MEAGTETAAGDHCGIQHSQRVDWATSIFHARSPRSPAPLPAKGARCPKVVLARGGSNPGAGGRPRTC
jgi:hypothetical protein